ncbi:hypothetical protein [Candidatus Venteria ishoeyi]|uniref:Uncharacterized protein n=1 Tax=Candidatus Venteria ishoeyi TaxID=1899563 RepID=A0A1H6F4R4_9GAMM|nr:hypothetical protein [Candidatus Venteria ishoeyi]MDM8545657.1 hypothetical protein [Candidatus Venteria ishoeyi]SEH04553.1 Uncharacterised protein [Candidatus Venteria ishoeyi]
MYKKKGLLQKTALYSGGSSFFLALVCAIFLFVKIGTIGFNDPVSASFLAALFFFVFVGIVLMVIGLADIPSFSFDEQDDSTTIN